MRLYALRILAGFPAIGFALDFLICSMEAVELVYSKDFNPGFTN